MEILAKLSPAQVKMILSNGDSSLGDILKHTFSDLLLKQVIQADRKFKQQQFKKSKRTIKSTYITIGPNFESYKPKSHELPLLKPFIKSKNLKIKFKHFIRMAFEEAYVKSTHKAELIKHPELKPYFKQNIFYKLFHRYPLNSKGKQIQHRLQTYFNEVNKTINQNLKDNRQDALKTLYILGGHIFLLNQLDIKLLKYITPELIEMFKLECLKQYSNNFLIDPYMMIGLTTENVFDLQHSFESESSIYDQFSSGGNIESDSSNFNGSESSGSSCGSSCGSGCGGCGS